MEDIATYVPSPPPHWVERFAKFGLTAKGIVYCLVGTIAFMAAFRINGNSTEDASRSSVFSFILQQPFGQVLLALIAVGLLCFALWRIIQAVKDTEQKGSDPMGIGRRISYAFSGIVYGSFAVLAAKMVMGSRGSDGGEDSRQTLARELLQQPFGQWLAGAVAIGTMIWGLSQIYRSFSGKYKKSVQRAHHTRTTENILLKTGKVGYLARGVVLNIIGYLFLKAALDANPQEAGNTTSAFRFLQESSYGSFLLGTVALGLICYGIFMFVRARYQAL
ncbi:DUF1206 domain-containing protein [Pontibacter sp. SGAir0037]|uniref:DUF1206 domain-containing protein n=1 Tax=Pontibacter sp. SGAir0037 TaxID=2571030 RepID=UPI0010CCB90B|nr:DUF1206 domain-containing protein [Pontibacter sp. SGAir0037]QCR22197.1 hypothetical protein C1N53_07465 [Pontibacter sp. SGAir0037]